MVVPLGLLSWILVGLALGVAGRFVLPGRPRPGWVGPPATGLSGGLGGGLRATALGFGGLLSADGRALLTAALGAILALLLQRLLVLRAAMMGAVRGRREEKPV